MNISYGKYIFVSCFLRLPCPDVDDWFGSKVNIKKHIAVVIPIKNIMAVAIINVPKKHLQRLDNEPI